MKILKSTVLSLFLIIGFIRCPNPEPDVTENPYLQENIPWPSLGSSAWPSERGDAQGSGRSQFSGPASHNGDTLVSLGAWTESNSVIGEDDNIYTVGTEIGTGISYLYKYTTSGDLIWKTEVYASKQNSITPTISSTGQVYISGDKSGHIYAINAVDGSTTWSIQVDDYVSSSIALDLDGNLYVTTGSPSKLISLTSDGVVRWELQLGSAFRDYLREAAVFSPDGDEFYAFAGDSLFGISTDGHVNWSFGSGLHSFSVLVDIEGIIYLNNEDSSKVTAIEVGGLVRWETPYSELQASTLFSFHAPPAMDSEGNLYYKGKDLDLNLGVFSISNEGVFRWFQNAPTGTDILCDSDDNIFIGRSSSTSLEVTCMSSSGEVLWNLIRDDIGGGNSSRNMAITASGELVVPLQGNWYYLNYIVY
ncbi:MAG: PQQ-binding-like beta-propeller repeat protein [Candidatus Marinimicrobia bacterium]|nr:PQQ-binding-like beta-propeller repeat protein [Candidatus Neomarinimicrobiota bacterium]